MSNKFLITNAQSDFIKANLVVASISATNLLPSQTLKTDSTKRIVSANITIGDIANLQPILDSVLTNPFNGTIVASDFKSDGVDSLNELNTIISSVGLLAQNNATNIGVLEQKNQHISSTTGYTNFAKSISTDGEVWIRNVDPSPFGLSLLIEGLGGLSGGRFRTDCPLDVGSTASIHTSGGILCEKTLQANTVVCNTIQCQGIRPAVFSQCPRLESRSALANPLYVDEFIALGWRVPGNECEWALTGLPAGGSYISSAHFAGGGTRVDILAAVGVSVDIWGPGLDGLGDRLSVLIYPEADTAFASPRYHVQYLRATDVLTLTVERMDPVF